MFCVVYRWTVKPGMEAQFRQSWSEITEAIFKQKGSLGSRLHQNEDGSWIAYAQWPTREHWEENTPVLGVELARAKRDECLVPGTQVEVIFALTVTDDLVKTAPSHTG